MFASRCEKLANARHDRRAAVCNVIDCCTVPCDTIVKMQNKFFVLQPRREATIIYFGLALAYAIMQNISSKRVGQ
jgi:hypothetical protein